MATFSIKDVLKIGWGKTKENVWFLIGFELLAVAVYIVVGDSVIGFIISAVVGFVLTQSMLRISRGEKVDFGNIFEKFTFGAFGHYLIAKILIAIFTLVGFILLIVPGVIIAIATAFTSFILVEPGLKTSLRNLTFWSAIKESYKMTRGLKWRIFLFVLVCVGLNIVGAIALVVGLLLTIPTTFIAFATIYNKRKSYLLAVKEEPRNETSPTASLI
jgi:uncharacterized membrane protein